MYLDLTVIANFPGYHIIITATGTWYLWFTSIHVQCVHAHAYIIICTAHVYMYVVVHVCSCTYMCTYIYSVPVHVHKNNYV